VAQRVEDLAEQLHRTAGQVAGELEEIFMAKAVVRRIQLREVLRPPAERVDVGDAMAARAIRMDQAQRTRVFSASRRSSTTGAPPAPKTSAAGSTELGSLAKLSRISSTAAALTPKSTSRSWVGLF
jgi:hypothetical protein